MCCELIDCGQAQICAERWISTEDKLKVIHHRIDGIEQKINSLNEMKNILIELRILSSQQLKDNESRDEILKQHSDSLNQTNMALININNKFEESDKNIQEVKNELKAIIKSNNLNILELAKEGIKYLMIASLSSGLTYLVVISKMGLVK